MSKCKELTESEIKFITEQSGMDDSIIRSWYKGKQFRKFLFGSTHILKN